MVSTRTAERTAAVVSVERAAERGRALVGLTASGTPERPGLRPFLVACDAAGARVSLVPDGALLLAGDAVELHVVVGRGARLELVEPAGTVAYPMGGGRASWDVTVTLAPGATLVWAGEPFVVADGARVSRRTTVQWGAGARLAMRETIVLGRHGEAGGHVDLLTTVDAADGTPTLADRLHLGPDSSPLLVGGARVIETITVLGARLEATGGTRLDLAAEGTVVRGLSNEAHTALPASVWAAAVAQVAREI